MTNCLSFHENYYNIMFCWLQEFLQAFWENICKIEKIEGRYLLKNYPSWKPLLIFWCFFLIQLSQNWHQMIDTIFSSIHQLVLYTDHFTNSLESFWVFERFLMAVKNLVGKNHYNFNQFLRRVLEMDFERWEHILQLDKGTQGLARQLCVNMHWPGCFPRTPAVTTLCSWLTIWSGFEANLWRV